MYEQALSAGTTIIGTVFLVLLLTRGVRGGFVPRLPFFYFYIAYTLIFTLVVVWLLLFLPRYHASVYWFGFLLSQVVEFAVLVEVSDHIFEPFPAVRSLGRLLYALTSALFLIFYIVPALFLSASSRQVMLDLTKRTSLTKALIILVLFAAARVYKLPVGRSITGIMLGFSIYLGVSIADSQFALTLGAPYVPIFRVSGPLAWTLGALVWVVALWNYQPSVVASPAAGGRARQVSVPLHSQLDRFNNALLRLLER